MLSSIRPTVTIGDAGGEVEGLSVPVSIMSFSWLLSHSTFFLSSLGMGLLLCHRWITDLEGSRDFVVAERCCPGDMNPSHRLEISTVLAIVLRRSRRGS